jgi:hypothetical protein
LSGGGGHSIIQDINHHVIRYTLYVRARGVIALVSTPDDKLRSGLGLYFNLPSAFGLPGIVEVYIDVMIIYIVPKSTNTRGIVWSFFTAVTKRTVSKSEIASDYTEQCHNLISYKIASSWQNAPRAQISF